MMHDLYPPGTVIGNRYTVQNQLGQGAVGTTYAALDSQTQHTVALKAISLSQTQDWKVLDLFEREARMLATLAHPNIPQYLDSFYVDSPRDRHFYLVQELITGDSLEFLIRGRGWQPDEAQVKAIALQVLEILDYLHSHTPPVIHRDLKPHNLICNQSGEIVLVDFGSVQQAFCHTLSRGGTFIGTVDYMPPEQFRGQATYASDLYSLGVTLIDLLTGAATISELPEQRLKLDFHAAVNISPNFAAWLERLIEPAAEDRFQDVDSAKQMLIKPNALALPKQRNDIVQLTSEEFLPYIASSEDFSPYLLGSRMKIFKIHNYFEVIIPPLLGAAAQITLMAFVVCIGIILSALNLPTFSVFLAVLILLASHQDFSIWSLFGYFALRINSESFQLYWRYFGAEHTLYEETCELLEAGLVKHSPLPNSQPVITCGLFTRHRQKPILFGTWLKKYEKDVLITELQDFLDDQ